MANKTITNLLINLYGIIAGNPDEFSLRHRLFNLTVMVGAILNIAATIVNISLELNKYITAFSISFVIISFLIYVISKKNKELLNKLLTLYIIVLLLSMIFTWISNSGIKGPTALTFVLIIFVFSFITDGIKRVIINLLFVLLYISLVTFEHYLPELIIPYPSESDMFYDVSFTNAFYLIVFSTLNVLFFNSFFKDKEIAEAQRDEILIKNKEIEFAQQELTIHKNNLEQLIIDRTKELKESNNNLKKSQIKAEKSDKLKTAFLSNMSHEIRTPLNSIIGLSMILKQKNIDKKKTDEFLEIIENKGHLLLNIINDIIDIAKVESNELVIVKKNCNVPKLLEDVYSTFENSIEKLNNEVQFELQIDSSLKNISILTDSLRLKQILINLIENARKFTKKGKIILGCTIKNNKLEFFVSDTGIGIEPLKRGIIFDRFTQVEDVHTKEYNGTGLGLAICKQLVELLNGEISVESEINKGSKFYFTIPLEKDIIKEEKNITNITTNNWGNNTILIAEDEDFNFIVIEEILEITKVNIIRAKNGKEVLDLLEKHNNIDLILLDIQMPIMSGYELCPILKTKYKNIPIIAQTAYVMEEDKLRLKKAGCNTIITKPIDFDELIRLISKYITKN